VDPVIFLNSDLDFALKMLADLPNYPSRIWELTDDEMLMLYKSSKLLS